MSLLLSIPRGAVMKYYIIVGDLKKCLIELKCLVCIIVSCLVGINCYE